MRYGRKRATRKRMENVREANSLPLCHETAEYRKKLLSRGEMAVPGGVKLISVGKRKYEVLPNGSWKRIC